MQKYEHVSWIIHNSTENASKYDHQNFLIYNNAFLHINDTKLFVFLSERLRRRPSQCAVFIFAVSLTRVPKRAFLIILSSNFSFILDF